MGTKTGILQMAHALTDEEMQWRLKDLSHSMCFQNKGEIFQKYKHLMLNFMARLQTGHVTCWRSRKF